MVYAMISCNPHMIQMKLPGNQVMTIKQSNCEDCQGLTNEEKIELAKLQKRDQEVRQHENMHMNNPDVQSIGGAKYTYTQGPDGKMYASGGKVTLTTGPTSDPKTAERKARALGDAALAPGEPSNQDLAAAHAAKKMEQEAFTLYKKIDFYA